ncbi:hypothetical protein BDB00DRAFT_804003 [Zychaea mexicana]|uniref:uncharacterized protein n=1 Tax=Zychaea mexicana TaxID=64656 RepID=UPI0022FE713B|nr:uncharacterized protein BDB00DRAFT_804003 [Zychaea mexicana]KAI9497775.1 hypothetical protein BDB00DRAFT_804003 [Zychaea mexicana]
MIRCIAAATLLLPSPLMLLFVISGSNVDDSADGADGADGAIEKVPDINQELAMMAPILTTTARPPARMMWGR